VPLAPALALDTYLVEQHVGVFRAVPYHESRSSAANCGHHGISSGASLSSMLALSPSRLLTLSAALACLASMVSAQNVVVVDAAGGPGSDFTSLPVALAAASAGDILLLRSGNYGNGSSSLVVAKSVVVQEDRAASAVIGAPLVVQGLAAHQSFTLRGVSIASYVTVAGPDLRVQNCLGGVRIEDALLQPSSFGKLGGVRVEASANVAFAYCSMQTGGVYGALPIGPSGLEWNDSRGAVHACEISGGVTLPFPSYTTGGGGGDGVLLTQGRMFVAGALIVGADGIPGSVIGVSCGDGGSGGDGFEIVGAASVLQTLGTAIASGQAGAAFAPCSPGADGVAVELLGGQLVEHSGIARTLATTSPVREGQTLRLDSTGAVGDYVVLLHAPQAAYAELFGVTGPLLLGGPLALFPQGLLSGPAGLATLSTSVVVQDLGAGVEGVLLRFQSAFVRASGEIYLSNESDTVLLDAGF
jgi:hypothetical protein